MTSPTGSNASSSTTRGLLVALSAVLLIIAAMGFVVQIGHLRVVMAPDLGAAFEGTATLPKVEVDAVLSQARDAVATVNSWGVWFKWAGTAASWASFLVTASITLIAGFHGRAPDPQGSAVDTAGLPTRTVRLIGFLAALSAVLTAFGSLAVTNSADYFRRADQCRELIIESRQLLGNPSVEADRQRVVLDDLATRITRC